MRSTSPNRLFNLLLRNTFAYVHWCKWLGGITSAFIRKPNRTSQKQNKYKKIIILYICNQNIHSQNVIKSLVLLIRLLLFFCPSPYWNLRYNTRTYYIVLVNKWIFSLNMIHIYFLRNGPEAATTAVLFAWVALSRLRDIWRKLQQFPLQNKSHYWKNLRKRFHLCPSLEH